MSETNQQPGQCNCCRADILVGGLCVRCAEALQRQNEAMRAILARATWHDWNEYQGASGYELSNVSRHEMEQALSSTAGSDLVTREEHERLKHDNEMLRQAGIAADGPQTFGVYSVNMAKLMDERDQLRTQLEAWQEAFGTNQLTHALAQLAAATQRAERAEESRETWIANYEGAMLKVAQLRADKEKAEKACAEKDSVLRACLAILKNTPVNYLCAPVCLSDFERWEHALSSDCGKGYVSKDELKPTIEMLKWLWEEDEMGWVNIPKGATREQASLECCKCDGSIAPDADPLTMAHEDYCLQGRVYAELARLQKLTEAAS